MLIPFPYVMWDNFTGAFVDDACVDGMWEPAASTALYQILSEAPVAPETLHRASFDAPISANMSVAANKLFAYLLHVHIMIVPTGCNFTVNLPAHTLPAKTALARAQHFNVVKESSISMQYYWLGFVPVFILLVYYRLLTMRRRWLMRQYYFVA